MLAIRIEFLTGVYMATRYNDPSRSEPEWPPHPDRLFSALVAAAAEPAENDLARIPEREASTLRWLLEPQRGPLHLAVSESRNRSAPDVYMPENPHSDEIPKGSLETGDENTRKKKRNALRGLIPVFRGKKPLPIPAVIPDDPVAYFIWPDADPDEHAEVLRGICSKVTYLGRSRSLVRLSVVDDPPPPTHVPDPLGTVPLRVPAAGRLSYLVDKYKRDGGKPEPSPTQPYRRLHHDRLPQERAANLFDRFWVFQPRRGDPLLPATATVKVTRALRAALIACIDQDQRRKGFPPDVPDVVHGHGQHPHCAYVALPFVHPWQRHADGAIKGVGVLLPRGISDDALMAAAAGLTLLQQNGLSIPSIGTWRLKEVPADDPPSGTLDRHTWSRPSRMWASATPVVFGHFPKPKKGGEAKVILDSLEMIGIDPDHVLELAIDRHSPLHGSPPSWYFKAAREASGSHQESLWVRHLTIRFDRPVRGPIVLGRMRYFGLGLMRPMEDR
ncbi:MAG TPA: type I-U CRISPR-associated protein Csb2 [Bryobacteraceae bacterium]|nr:type I-U CRISPR-associated protein Csb2 [Bryobacteraceae bacterium]